MEDKNKYIINTLIKKENIVRFIKSQRLQWAAHVIRIDPLRTVKMLTEWDPCLSKPVGKPRLRWIDQVEEDLKKMKLRYWRENFKNRRLWNEIMKQAKTHKGCSADQRRRRRKKKKR
jgi:hypothetical protein